MLVGATCVIFTVALITTLALLLPDKKPPELSLVEVLDRALDNAQEINAGNIENTPFCALSNWKFSHRYYIDNMQADSPEKCAEFCFVYADTTCLGATFDYVDKNCTFSIWDQTTAGIVPLPCYSGALSASDGCSALSNAHIIGRLYAGEDNNETVAMFRKPTDIGDCSEFEMPTQDAVTCEKENIEHRPGEDAPQNRTDANQADENEITPESTASVIYVEGYGQASP